MYEIMESTFGGVSEMLNGKKFPQNMRALRLVVEKLLRPVFDTEDLNSCRDLETVLDDVARESRTAKVWVECLIRAVLLMMIYVRAEREADWLLHIFAVKLILPFVSVVRHINYARYGLYYLRSMAGLPSKVMKCFMQREHVN